LGIGGSGKLREVRGRGFQGFSVLLCTFKLSDVGLFLRKSPVEAVALYAP
jgi:hypothetical protein